MEYGDIRFECDADGVALITLHRPDKLNAFSGRMGRELGDAYRRCDQDDAVRVIVLTGAGRAFCAGADMAAGDETFAKREGADFSAAAVDPPAFALRKPVIAAVNGHAIGLGFTLALQCDLRVIAREAKLGVVQVRLGVMPDAYAHFTLPRLVGMERAAEILLTGRTMLGTEAHELGVGTRCLPSVEVLPAALELAREIAINTAPLSVAVTKRLLWESFELSAAAVEQRETELHHLVMGKSDASEGVKALLEGRQPAWTLSLNEHWPK